MEPFKKSFVKYMIDLAAEIIENKPQASFMLDSNFTDEVKLLLASTENYIKDSDYADFESRSYGQ